MMRSGSVLQTQPALTSVRSVSPWPRVAAVVSPAETVSPEGVTLGVDGDAQAPIPNPPTTTNKVQARENTFDMLDL